MTFPALLLALAAAQAEKTSPNLYEFPPGPVAARSAQLDTHTVPVATPGDLGAPNTIPAVAPDAWSRATTWERWSALVGAEARVARGDPERRARLALMAAAQGRSEDAWAHFAAIDDPAWSAAVMPTFLPGVPAGSTSGIGGAPGRLPEGIALAPLLPPPSTDAVSDGRIDRRAMTMRALQVGGAIVSLRVSVEAEGVQIDVRHVAGERTRLAILLPLVPGFGFAEEYVDWYAQPERRIPHVVELVPGEAEHTIYGRFQPVPRAATHRVPRFVPGSIAQGGLWFEIDETDTARGLIAAIAGVLDRGPFGFKCGVRAPSATGDTWSGVAFALTENALRAERLAWLASAIEEFALRGGSR